MWRDDAEASIYRGAPEVWYDRVDEDCLGGNDFDRALRDHVLELSPEHLHVFKP